MHRNDRYFDKNEGKHNLFGQEWDVMDDVDTTNVSISMRPAQEASPPANRRDCESG